MLKPNAILMAAKVTTNRGDGIVVGILRTKPFKYDVRLLATDKVLLYLTEENDGVRLIDNCPDDAPEGVKNWIINRRDKGLV